jgi:NTP pyrophosphatase (non-canonical NTP hydrolase)
MTKQDRIKLYNEAMKRWGEDSQINQMLEEMGELITAINKYRRYKNCDKKTKAPYMANLFEEMADVQMCLEQMQNYFGEQKYKRAFKKKMQKFINCLK